MLLELDYDHSATGLLQYCWISGKHARLVTADYFSDFIIRLKDPQSAVLCFNTEQVKMESVFKRLLNSLDCY